MPPKITNSLAWQQAELLMQPAFIRILDHLRKQLDVSTWKGSFRDVLIWPAGTTAENQAIATQLIQQLENASIAEAEEIKQRLSNLPTPVPGYHLRLQQQDQEINIDLWELCYQVCFLNYSQASDLEVKIDTSLIDELGDVDWQLLDKKAQELVASVFTHLPA